MDKKRRSAQVGAMLATRGAATNVRAGGAMQSLNSRRDRSRGDRKRNAIRKASVE